jgi:hypothetical protein
MGDHMSNEIKSEDKPKFHINLLYLGVREGKDTPRVHEWVEIEGTPNDGSPLPKDVKTRIYGAVLTALLKQSHFRGLKGGHRELPGEAGRA